MKLFKKLACGFIALGLLSSNSTVFANGNNELSHNANKKEIIQFYSKKFNVSEEQAKQSVAGMEETKTIKEVIDALNNFKVISADEAKKILEEGRKKDLGEETPSGGVQLFATGSPLGTMGDIILDMSASSRSSGGDWLPSFGHAAIVDSDPTFTWEAFAYDWSPSRIVGGKAHSGPAKYYNRFNRGDKANVYGLRPKNPKSGDYKRAYQFAKKQADANKPYSYAFFDKWRTSNYYCSSLVWQAWKSTGIDLDYTTIGDDGLVLPLDLYTSHKTKMFY